MPLAVPSGSFTTLATPLPTLSTAPPAAFAKISPFETSESRASASTSRTRVRRTVRPSATMSPKSETISNTWYRPSAFTSSETVWCGPLRRSAGRIFEAWNVGAGSNAGTAAASIRATAPGTIVTPRIETLQPGSPQRDFRFETLAETPGVEKLHGEWHLGPIATSRDNVQ